MPNYTEENITGTMRTRCYKIVINNPRAGGSRSAVFSEENIVLLDNDQVIATPSGSCATLFDPNAVVQLYDPLTGSQDFGTITHAEIYKILYSFYRDTANKRDLGVPQPPIV